MKRRTKIAIVAGIVLLLLALPLAAELAAQKSGTVETLFEDFLAENKPVRAAYIDREGNDDWLRVEGEGLTVLEDYLLKLEVRTAFPQAVYQKVDRISVHLYAENGRALKFDMVDPDTVSVWIDDGKRAVYKVQGGMDLDFIRSCFETA